MTASCILLFSSTTTTTTKTASAFLSAHVMMSKNNMFFICPLRRREKTYRRRSHGDLSPLRHELYSATLRKLNLHVRIGCSGASVSIICYSARHSVFFAGRHALRQSPVKVLFFALN